MNVLSVEQELNVMIIFKKDVIWCLFKIVKAEFFQLGWEFRVGGKKLRVKEFRPRRSYNGRIKMTGPSRPVSIGATRDYCFRGLKGHLVFHNYYRCCIFYISQSCIVFLHISCIAPIKYCAIFWGYWIFFSGIPILFESFYFFEKIFSKLSIFFSFKIFSEIFENIF